MVLSASPDENAVVDELVLLPLKWPFSVDVSLVNNAVRFVGAFENAAASFIDVTVATEVVIAINMYESFRK